MTFSMLLYQRLDPVWKKLYSSRSAYGLEDLSLEQMSSLQKRLKRDRRLRHKYWQNIHRHANSTEWSDCDDDCKQKAIQDIRIVSPFGRPLNWPEELLRELMFFMKRREDSSETERLRKPFLHNSLCGLIQVCKNFIIMSSTIDASCLELNDPSGPSSLTL